MENRNKGVVSGIVAVVIVMIIALVAMAVNLVSDKTKKDNRATEFSDSKYSDVSDFKVDYDIAEEKKGSVSLGLSLYDELPEIDKYPLLVESNADIVLEVFSSGEKAGTTHDYESWLIDTVKKFNNKGVKVGGKTVGVSLRNVSSGLGADYIISGKYIPDLYTPSSSLYGNYINAQGGSSGVEVAAERFVGNTAGILVAKSSKLKSFDDVVKAVKAGEINLGYTAPTDSATGLNFLMALLSSADSSNLVSDKAGEELAKFQDNIPFVADTTMQMRDSAMNGSLDGMVLEYQTYTNEKELKNGYNFIPFGVRHDNPLYMTKKGQSKRDAVEEFCNFCLSSDIQQEAIKKGFNANDDYKGTKDYTGGEITNALKLYKQKKNSGRDIIAVFVADCSGSMAGDGIEGVRASLSNGINYINENNYVGLITYNDDVTCALPIRQFDFNQKAYFQGAVEHMTTGGGTSSYEALAVAMQLITEKRKELPDADAMIFLLSDGMATGSYTLKDIGKVLKKEKIPVYTICYTDEADTDSMKALSAVNEAANYIADSDDVVYTIKCMFNSNL